LCFLLLAALSAHAAEGSTFTVESGGIRISITQPWSLSTRALIGQLDYVLSLKLYDDEEGVIAGGGVVSVFPYQDDPYPDREELRRMDTEALTTLVAYYHEYYLKFPPEDEADPPVVEEINGVTGVVVRKKKDTEGASAKDFSARYYFSFKNKFVYLGADVIGDDAAGELFKRIFASFVPQTSSPADMTTVHSDGMGLSCPRSWPVAVGGSISDPTWAMLAKEDENEDTIAKVTVFQPVAAGNVPTGMEERLRAAYSILETNSPTKSITPLGVQQTTAGDFPATLTRVRVAVESESKKTMLVELRDIAVGDTIVTMVTTYANKPSKETEKELEAVYASFTWAP
ncbi:MAG: hypothetical protein LBS65_07460, partial [Desulfovibrio sp.]|nr:hypothetical protein [Desulfovibrio sp.]